MMTRSKPDCSRPCFQIEPLEERVAPAGGLLGSVHTTLGNDMTTAGHMMTSAMTTTGHTMAGHMTGAAMTTAMTTAGHMMGPMDSAFMAARHQMGSLMGHM